jgi:hypothetical protein
VLGLLTTRTQLPYGPSNLHLVDVSTDTPQWIGAVTLGTTPVDGIGRRVVLRGEQAFVLTAGQGKGLQVIDLATAKANVDTATALGTQGPAYFTMLQQLGLEGQGFGQDAIASTIFLDTGTGQNSQQADLAVVDTLVDGVQVPLAVTTGRRALALVNPQTTEVLYSGPILDATNTPVLTIGQYVAAGFVGPRPIALVAGPFAGGRRLVVVDLTTPRSPRALATLDLPAGVLDTWTRIVLKDGTAYLGGTAGTTLVNVADPLQPRIAGSIAGTGGFLAVSDNGVLLSSDHFYRTARGLQTAALDVTGVIVRPRTTFMRPTAAPTQEETTREVVIPVRVYPVTTVVTAARVEVYNGGVLAAALDSVVAQGSAFVSLAQGFSRVVNAVTTAIFSFTTAEGRTVRTAPVALPLGQLRLRLDSNNDTTMGEGTSAEALADDQAAAQGKAFAFWEADPTLSGEDALVDYARLTIRRGVPIDPQTRVALRIVGGSWEMHRRVSRVADYAGTLPTGCTEDGKLQFCHSTAVAAQLRLNDVTDARYAPTARGNGVIEVPYDLLTRLDSHFLFRCVPGAQVPGCVAPELELGELRADGTFVRLHAVPLEVRPLSGWMSIKRARSDAVSEEVRSGPLAASDVEGWAQDTLAGTTLTADAPLVTVIVHGFDVAEAAATESTFPTLFKRLYWAGHRVHARQNAHTIGIAWPGGTFPGSLQFPRQESNAFRTGELLAAYLTSVKAQTISPRVSILAHSLGSLVANAAVRYADGLQATDSLAMIDAAVAREAFFSAGQAMPVDPAEDILRTGGAIGLDARNYGFPSDAVWDALWDSPELEIRTTVRQEWRDAVDAPGTSEATYRRLYTYRWNRVPQPTPWRGVFAGNLSRVRVFNFFHPQDQALKLDVNGLWWRGQVHEKPFKLLDPLGLYWASLNGLSAADKAQWIADAFVTVEPLAPDAPLGVVDAARRNRRWAELAYYFRGLSRPAGIGPLESLSLSRNVSVGDVVAPPLALAGFPLYQSHTFLTSRPLHEVWPIFSQLADTAMR